MGPLGWPFPSPSDAASDPAMASPPAPGHEDFKHLREVYFSVNPDYTGRFTVPVLWDKVTKRIVSNESSEIVRMFNSAFDGLVGEEYRAVDLYPEGLRGEVEEANAWQYDLINNGVYKSGFATTQEAYEKNVVALFEALDRAEEHLKTSPGPYWFGEKLTEVDVRLWVTIIRFDVSPPPPPNPNLGVGVVLTGAAGVRAALQVQHPGHQERVSGAAQVDAEPVLERAGVQGGDELLAHQGLFAL